jgi:hypothetical protein
MAEKKPPSELTPRQRRAVASLLSCKNTAEAAAAADVSERTLYRWQELPLFRQALAKAEGQLIDDTTRRLAGLQEKAIQSILDIFSRADKQAGLNTADFFTVVDYKDKDTGLPARKLVLDVEKIQELGTLVKRLKVKGGDIEIESYSAQDADTLKLRAAQAVLDYLLKMRELRNFEDRLAALEEAVNAKSQQQR